MSPIRVIAQLPLWLLLVGVLLILSVCVARANDNVSLRRDGFDEFVPNAGSLTYDQLGGKPYVISYDERALTINGQRIFLLSAGVHYPRSSPSMWPQIMQRIRASGCNNVQSYFFHNYHERVQGVWDWSTESRDLAYFLKLAAQYGLFVTLRLGIYVDAEWHHGGIAIWTRGQGFEYRSFNPGWTNYMGTALRQVVQYVEPYLAKNGGPIIITQIENEWGSAGTDPQRIAYMDWMVQLTQTLNTGTVWIMCSGIGPPPIIYTCNGGGCDGYVPEQQTDRKMPAMWSENWVAWFESWGGAPYWTDPRELAFAVAEFALAGGVYQNYYMSVKYHGGTNFGATPSDDVTTSYDYDGQLDEYGVPNEPKYTHQQNLHSVLNSISPILIGNNFSMPLEIKDGVAAYQYGTVGQPNSVLAFRNTNYTSRFVNFTFLGKQWSISNQTFLIYDGFNFTLLFDSSFLPNTSSTVTDNGRKSALVAKDRATDAESFPSVYPNGIVWYPEPIGVWSGVGISHQGPLDQVVTTLYKTQYFWLTTGFWLSTADVTLGVNLTLSNAGDHEMFFLDENYVGRGDGAWSTSMNVYPLSIPSTYKSNDYVIFSVLSIMQGMDDSGNANSQRGLNGAVVWSNETDLRANQWVHQVGLQGEFLQLTNPTAASSFPRWNQTSRINTVLTWYWLNITTPTPTGDPNQATWQFDMRGMGKGNLWCNGFHVGQYWSIRDSRNPAVYSQPFYHIPRDYLMPPNQTNTIIVFEEAGGDPTTVQLMQRNSFKGELDITDPYAYQGQKNVAPPVSLEMAMANTVRVSKPVIESVDAALSPTASSAVIAPALSPGVIYFDQLGDMPYSVSYDNRSVTINGVRVLLISAGIHYPRSSPSMWPQMFAAVRAAGMNCIQTYVFHNYHEYVEGVWDWSTESRNLRQFIQQAGAAGLFVNLRIGPYVCAEWHNGGQPMWTHDAGFAYRYYNPGWIQYMGQMMKEVVEYVTPLLAKNGGPIIITQIENEYGNMGNDPGRIGYVEWCAQLTVTLNTSTVWIMCSEGDAPYPIIDTCNGGSCGGWAEGQYKGRQQPAMWTENWVAWFQHWGDPPQWKDPRTLSYEVVYWYAAGGIYMNHYMYQGGTNFGRTVGGPDITTTYDYDGNVRHHTQIQHNLHSFHIKSVASLQRCYRLVWC